MQVELLITFARLVRTVDADMLIGWDVRQASIGFLIDRANCHLIPSGFLIDFLIGFLIDRANVLGHLIPSGCISSHLVASHPI